MNQQTARLTSEALTESRFRATQDRRTTLMAEHILASMTTAAIESLMLNEHMTEENVHNIEDMPSESLVSFIQNTNEYHVVSETLAIKLLNQNQIIISIILPTETAITHIWARQANEEDGNPLDRCPTFQRIVWEWNKNTIQ